MLHALLIILAISACGRDGYECKTVAENVYECRDGDKVAYYDSSGHSVAYHAPGEPEAQPEEIEYR